MCAPSVPLPGAVIDTHRISNTSQLASNASVCSIVNYTQPSDWYSKSDMYLYNPDIPLLDAFLEEYCISNAPESELEASHYSVVNNVQPSDWLHRSDIRLRHMSRDRNPLFRILDLARVRAAPERGCHQFIFADPEALALLDGVKTIIIDLKGKLQLTLHFNTTG